MHSLSIRLFGLAIAIAFCVCISGTADAHGVFKDPLEERYGLKSVSCSACHPTSDKHVHNKFGRMFYRKFKGLDLTKKLEAAKEESKEAEEAFEQVMVAEFEKALVEIETQQMTIAEVFQGGMWNGTKLTDESLEKVKEELDEWEAAEDAKE